MHEITIARNILEIVYDTVPSEKLHSIDAIELDVGLLSNIMTDSLISSFNALVENTNLSYAKLVIIPTPVKIKCSSCGSTSEKNDFIFSCPECGLSAIEVTGGSELVLTSIKMKA